MFIGYYKQYWPDGFLCPGVSKGSTGSGSDFKASQKTGPRLKVSSDRLGEATNGAEKYQVHKLKKGQKLIRG